MRHASSKSWARVSAGKAGAPPSQLHPPHLRQARAAPLLEQNNNALERRGCWRATSLRVMPPQTLPPQAKAVEIQRPAPAQIQRPAPPSTAPTRDDEMALLMHFTTSAPAGPELLSADIADLQDVLPAASSRDLGGRSASSRIRELSSETEPASSASGPTESGLIEHKRKRDELSTESRQVQRRAVTGAGGTAPAPPSSGPAPPSHSPEVWWVQDNKTKAWKEYDPQDSAELEHALEAKQSHPPMQRQALPQVHGGKISVDIEAMEQLGPNGQPPCKVLRHIVTANEIVGLPCSKDMLPKPAGPAVAGLLYEIASHAGLQPLTGLSTQTMPNGSLGFRLDLSGKERDEPDIEEKGNYIAELLNAVFAKIGKDVDFGCTSTKEDQATPTHQLPLAENPKDDSSMLALLGQGDSSKPDIRTVRVQRCLDAQNKPIYKRTIFKWAPNKAGGGKWRRQKRWDSVRKHLSDPVLVPTTIGTVRMQFWSNETGGGQREGDFSQVYTERSGGVRDHLGSTAKRGGIAGSFKRCAELLACTRRLTDYKTWKTLFDEVVYEKLQGTPYAMTMHPAVTMHPAPPTGQDLQFYGADATTTSADGSDGHAQVLHQNSSVLRNLLQPRSAQPQAQAHSGTSGVVGSTGSSRTAGPAMKSDAAAVVNEMNEALLESTQSDPRQKADQSFQADLMQLGMEDTHSKPLPGEVLRAGWT